LIANTENGSFGTVFPSEIYMRKPALVWLLCAMGLFISTRLFATVFPPNNLYLEDNLWKRDTTINEARYNELLDQIAEVYEPIVASFGGAALTLERQWINPEVNAWAYRPGDKIWRIVVTGGIARRPEVTPDAFVMATCHEIGHFLAGFPHYEFSWSSAEGQADYYATQTCTKLMWEKDLTENAKARDLISETAKGQCDDHYDTEAEQNLCYRQMLAATSLARILKVIGRETVDASFETPDTSKVAKTYAGHLRHSVASTLTWLARFAT
jgi:hypothetical protein